MTIKELQQKLSKYEEELGPETPVIVHVRDEYDEITIPKLARNISLETFGKEIAIAILP